MERGNLSRVVRYIIDSGGTSKAMVAKDLKLSMPTVLQIFKTLTEKGIVKEDGVYESTGGRKAKSIVICEDLRYSVGIDITGRHVGFAMVDMCGTVVRHERKRIAFEPALSYFKQVAEEIERFIKEYLCGMKQDEWREFGIGELDSMK